MTACLRFTANNELPGLVYQMQTFEIKKISVQYLHLIHTTWTNKSELCFHVQISTKTWMSWVSHVRRKFNNIFTSLQTTVVCDMRTYRQT